MKTSIIAILWTAALGVAAAALVEVYSRPLPPDASLDSGAGVAGQAERIRDLGRRAGELDREEQELQDRISRIRATPLPAADPLSASAAEAEEEVDAIAAMTDLSESARSIILVVRHRAVENIGVKDWFIDEYVPYLKDRLRKAGIPDEEAARVCALLTELVPAVRQRDLAVYEDVAATPAKSEEELLRAFHRVEGDFADSIHRRMREGVQAIVGPDRAGLAYQVASSGYLFRRRDDSDSFRWTFWNGLEASVRTSLLRTLEEEIARQIEAGRAAAPFSESKGLLLTASAAQAIRNVIESAKPHAVDDRFVEECASALENGVAKARQLVEVVEGLRRLRKKK